MQKVIEMLRAWISSCTRFQPIGRHVTWYVSFFFLSFFFFCILHRKIVHPRMTCSRENRPTYIPRTYIQRRIIETLHFLLPRSSYLLDFLSG